MDVEGEVPAATVTNGWEASAAPAPSPTSLSAEQLDVEAYAAQYKGRTRLQRLLFIGENCGVESVALEALRMVHDEARTGEDAMLYHHAALKIGGRLGPRYLYDQGCVDSVKRRAEQRKEKLENELSRYSPNQIEETLRMGYNDIGDFYYGYGHLSEAFKSYLRTRDYCTTSKHVVQMCMNVILVSIQLREFAHVTNYVSEAEQTSDPLDPLITSKLQAAAGLAYLETKKYKLAARKFLETGPDLGSNYSEVIAAQDVAVYGALCALASFDRSDLKSKVIDNINFRSFLELVPEVRELVNDFYSSRYGSCLEHLEKLKPNLLLDIHLHEHLGTLYKSIRQKSIIQYTLAFISVDLYTMAGAFKTSVSMLEKELAALITDNNIKARIDSHNKILYVRHADQRNATFQQVLQTCSELEMDVKAMLLRANLMERSFNESNLAEATYLEETKSHKLPAPEAEVNSDKRNARGLPFLHGKKGHQWLKLTSIADEMICRVEAALSHLHELARKLNVVEEGIDRLAVPGIDLLPMRIASLKWAIGTAQAIIANHFSPTSLTRPMRKVVTSSEQLHEELPDDIFKSLLQPEQWAGSFSFVRDTVQDLRRVAECAGFCGENMYRVSLLMDFQNEDFILFRQNSINRSAELQRAIDRAAYALLALQAIRSRISQQPEILRIFLGFRQFVPPCE